MKKPLKRTDWKKWTSSASYEINTVSFCSEKLEELKRLEYFFRQQFKDLLVEIQCFDKIEEFMDNIHSITIQEVQGQYRLYAVCAFYDDNGVSEKRISLATVGNRTGTDEEKNKMVYKIQEIKATFGAFRGVSQSILALQ